ncbi:large ribosomal subunit protein mL65-like [Hoplias malabaricus]|uniref:large ribosomal subunit protein mL65-like n=1 Tax=Hoplias malabaricus TaxID=27720 RepID=UPI0034624FB4
MAVCGKLSLLRSVSARPPRLTCRRHVHEESVSSGAQYPPVLPSRTAKSKSAKRRVLLDSFEQLGAAEPQDKIRALSRVQRMKYVVYPQTFALGADRWYQHFTRTAYLSGLPEKYSSRPESGPETQPMEDSALPELRSALCNSLLQENWYMKKGRTFLHKRQEQMVYPFLTNIVAGLVNSLATYNPVLRLSSLDFEPQVNFYWLNGERTIPRGHRSGRVEPQRFQIDDKPHSQIRIPHQLSEFVPIEADVSAEVPVIQFEPDHLPLFRRQYENNIFTGAKLEDPCCYGHTQFHVVPAKFYRDRLIKKNLPEHIETFLRANAIASLFAWTGAQAMYQGFWSEQDVSRPFVSQAIITDGQYFSFFCYQLNTLALSSFSTPDNLRKNLCWGTESMCLYDSIMEGDVLGWDDSVLRLLVQFLLNKPHN